MDTSSLKKAAFGGYDKTSVHNLLDELALAHSVKLSELAEEKGELTDKIIVLEKKIESLEEVVGASEKDKDYVANAIVSAEKEAAKILANAQKEADELLANARRDAEDLLTTSKNESEELLTNALKESEEITSKARFDSETLKANTKAELKGDFDTLKDLRISALQTMNSYKDKLDAIAKRLGADE